jgi:hypothetical protein
MPKKSPLAEIPQDLSTLLELTAINPDAPRQLPDQDDPVRQPMPAHPDPRDPQPDADPETSPPANGDPKQDSGPVDQTNPPRNPPDEDEPEDPDQPDEPDEPMEQGDPDDEDNQSADNPAVREPREPPPLPPPAPGSTHPASPTSNLRYESRIQILDAFQYPGSLKDAPAWIDRNWVAYATDFDEVRGIEPGPCLKVPLSSGHVGVCRAGDFVCRQSVTLATGLPVDIRIEVWDRSQFEKLFVPVPKSRMKLRSSQPLILDLQAVSPETSA